MKPLVYLIGRKAEWTKEIESVIGPAYRIKQINRSDIMTEIFRQMPSCLVIVEDEIDRDGFLMVESTISLEYIPIICVSFEKEEWQIEKCISGASYIGAGQLEILLPALIQQATFFGHQYHCMHVVQDTYEVMNEEIRGAMVKYLDEDRRLDQKVLLDYIKTIYVENYFIDNQPMTAWLIKIEDEDKGRYRAYRLPISQEQDYVELCFEDEAFKFDPFRETGFFKNDASEEMSDIETIEQLVPPELLQASQAIENVASYATDDMMLIAFNYNEPIRQRDLNVLKALTIKLDLMIAIKDKLVALEDSFDYTMNALARAAEGKDDVTGHHIKRVNHYSRVIAAGLNQDRRFVKNIAVAAQMHDVGKIFIPESVLNKPGKLTDEEFDQIKTHTVQGEVIIGESKDLQMAARIARYHHERYDGTGYPDGLAGEEIPLEARIVFLADIYDALRSERPYKRGFTHEEAVKIITEGDGRVEPKHFDPDILDLFVERHPVFDEIFESLRD